MKSLVTVFRERHGFTMIEVVVVLILLVVFSSLVLSMFSTSNVELIAQSEILKSHLRYAQIKAMNDTVTWGISFSTATTYTLQRSGITAPSSNNLPGDNSQTHTLTNGVTITSGVGTSVTFNEWGSPGGVDFIVILIPSQGSATTITITKNTGFIP